MASDTLQRMITDIVGSKLIADISRLQRHGTPVTLDSIRPAYHLVTMMQSMMSIDLCYDEVECIYCFVMQNLWPAGLSVEIIRKEIDESVQGKGPEDIERDGSQC